MHRRAGRQVAAVVWKKCENAKGRGGDDEGRPKVIIIRVIKRIISTRPAAAYTPLVKWRMVSSSKEVEDEEWRRRRRS